MVEGIDTLMLQFYPLVTGLKSIEIYGESIKSALEYGKGCDGSSVYLAPVEKSDLLLVPVKDTFYTLPWDPTIAGVICDIYEFNGIEYKLSPRYILKKVLRDARERGYKFLASFEIEFFLLNDFTKPIDEVGYFSPPPIDRGFEVRREISKALMKSGIKVDYGHHEVAKGQYEITLRVTDALTMADNVVKARFFIKNIAKLKGLRATLMPKPFIGMNGSGQHIHMSLTNVNTGENIFAKNHTDISDKGKYFIGGILYHIKSLTALIAPSINSYKRLVPYHEAPTSKSWGYMNRTTAIRVPGARKKSSVRVEFRTPDNLCNPYLALASILIAGLHGIEEKIDPGDPIEENAWVINDRLEPLPGTLKEALEELDRDSFLKRELGEYAIDYYIKYKMKEWEEFVRNFQWNPNEITKWELTNYLDLI